MKTVLFIPGFREGLNSRNYLAVLEGINSKGFKAIFVPIKYKYRTVEDWVEELNRTYIRHDPENTILCGFSFGAVTALLAAAERNPSQLWLCSLSSYFTEDLTSVPQSWLDYIGKSRTNSFKKIRFSTLAEQIKCPTLVFVGGVEAKKWPLMGTRAREATKLISGAKLYIAPKASHDVGDLDYIKTIVEAIS